MEGRLILSIALLQQMEVSVVEGGRSGPSEMGGWLDGDFGWMENWTDGDLEGGEADGDDYGGGGHMSTRIG